MNIKNLSKCKYIYRVYVSKTDEFHCEKYPIVYANNRYAYFKITGDERLNEISIARVLDNINDIPNDIPFYRGSSIYFWSDNCITKETFDIFKKKMEVDRLKREMRQIENRLAYLKRSYELSAPKMEVLKKQLEELENEISKMDKTENV